MIYCFDLDGTLCTQETDYSKAKPIIPNIIGVNNIYNRGDIVKIFTARGSSSGKDYYELTTKQLKDWGVKYHELILKKPSYDYIIDDKAINVYNWNKEARYIKGLIAGCFDLIHPGYIKMFKEAKNICNYLIIALHDDPSIERPDSKYKPVHTISERRMILESIKYIDLIIEYKTEDDLYQILKQQNPDVRILGSDYKDTQYNGYDLGLYTYFHDRNHNYSTTNLRKKICEQ